MRRLAPALVALAMAGAACTAGDDPAPRALAGSIPGERVSTDDALPRGFSRQLPLPRSRRVLYSAVSPIGYVVYFSSEQAGDSLTRLVLSEAGKAGWTLHACRRTEGGDPFTTIVLSRAGEGVASYVVGFAPQFASRVGGKRYTFFVSVATRAPTPDTRVESC